MKDENLSNNIIDGNNESTEVSAATEEPVVVNQSAEDNGVAEAVESSEKKGNEKVVTERNNPGKYSHEEQMTFSFKRQLAKQRTKHDQEMAEMRKLVESLQDRINNPDKYRPKYRDDFNTADEYIDYRSEQQFNKLMEEQRAKEEKAAKEKSDFDAMTNYYRERAQKHINTLYPTDEAKAHYKEVVDKAFNDGLGDLLDKDENVSNFLMRRPYGPAILMAIAESPNEYLDRLYSDPYMSSSDRIEELRDIEHEIIKKVEQAKKEEQIKTENVNQEQPKVVGKPGISTQSKRNIWDDEKALNAFLDARR